MRRLGMLITVVFGLTLVAVPAQAATTPTVGLGRACPGHPVAVSGSGFPDGSYQLRAAAGTFSTSTVTVSGGRLPAGLTLRLPADSPHSVDLTVTRSGTTVVGATVVLADPVVQRGDADRLPLTETMRGDCFAPGETVAVTTPAGVTSLLTRTADANGVVLTTAGFYPAAQPVDATLTMIGRTSRQVGTGELIEMSGTTLLPGQSLTDSAGQSLSSHLNGWQLFPVAGSLALNQTHPGGDGTSVQLVSSQNGGYGSRLVMQTDGDLAFYSSTGRLLWASGTKGTGLRLVLQDDGNLVIGTPGGTRLWSWRTGAVGAPDDLHTLAYLASSRPGQYQLDPRTGTVSYRQGTAMYLNALIKQATAAAQLVPSAGRQVYLQRYLPSGWQTFLQRTTDAHGRFTVGFNQAKVFQYRLVVARSAHAASARSASTFR